VILNRTVSEAKKLANLLNRTFNKKIVADLLSPSIIQEKIVDSDILVNATSVGMNPDFGQSLITPNCLSPNLTVMDIVYNPVETKLVMDAKSVGAKVVSGVEMLIYQGATSFEVWTGKPAPINVMRKATLEHLNRV